MSKPDLFSIDEISNLGMNEEFKNVNKLVGGAKTKKANTFTPNLTQKNKINKETNNDDNDIVNVTENNDENELKEININKIDLDINNEENNMTDNEEMENKANNEENNMTDNEEMENKGNMNIEELNDAEIDNMLNNNDEDDLLDNEDADNEMSSDEEEANNKKLKNLINNNSNNATSTSVTNSNNVMLNLSSIKAKFYQYILDMQQSNEEINTDINADVEQLLPLFEDKNTKLHVLNKLVKEGVMVL